MGESFHMLSSPIEVCTCSMHWVADLTLGGETEWSLFETAYVVRDAKSDGFAV